jgi:hypothetical protein
MIHSSIVRHIAVFSLAIAGSCCTPSLANAAPDRPAATKAARGPVLHIDFVDRSSAGARQAVRLSVPVAASGNSSVETHAGSARYEVRVHRDGSPESPGSLRIDLHRVDQRHHPDRTEQRSDLRVNVSVALQRGERALITRLERPDGSSTDVSAALR